MDGLSRMLGVPTEMEIDGKMYEVQPRVLYNYAEPEARILASRRSALEIAAEKAALFKDLPEVRKEVFKAALEIDSRGFATTEEVAAWLNSPRGIAYSTWASIKHNDDAPTEERVAELVFEEHDRRLVTIMALGMSAEEASEQVNLELLQKFIGPIDRASGSDERGNLTGSGPSQPGKPASERDQSKTPTSTDESLGDTSTSESAKSAGTSPENSSET